MRNVFFAGLVWFGLAGCMNCDQFVTNPITVSPSGQKICTRHHIPLVTVHGYAIRGWNDPDHRVGIYDPIGDAAIVEACNPNSVFQEQSLHRSKKYPERALVTYCPKCEEAVAKAAAKPNGMGR